MAQRTDGLLWRSPPSKPYRTYTAEQKDQAMAIVAIAGETVAARGLQLPRSVVHNWAREAGVSGPAPAKSQHGTRSRYKAGCRCEECTEAQRVGARQWRDQIIDRPPRRQRPKPDRRRFPLAPLLVATAVPSLHELARLTDVDPRQVHRWKEYGLRAEDADRVATMLGHHPAMIWQSWA